MHNIYSKRGVFIMEDEDEISSVDAGFMIGYIEGN